MMPNPNPNPNPNRPSAQASVTGSGSSFPAAIGQEQPVASGGLTNFWCVAGHHSCLVLPVSRFDRLMQRVMRIEHPKVILARVEPLVGRRPDIKDMIEPGNVLPKVLREGRLEQT